MMIANLDFKCSMAVLQANGLSETGASVVLRNADDDRTYEEHGIFIVSLGDGWYIIRIA